MNTPTYGMIVVSAPSGTGKSTLCTRLLTEKSESLALSISTTSRAPRGQEKHAREYFFVTKDQFKEKIANEEFAEWALVHENYYGTEKKTLEGFWTKKHHVLLDIDVQGAERLRTLYPHRILTVFLLPPSLEELERRLRTRGTENEESIRKRMKNAQEELARTHEFDHVIVNNDLETAYHDLKTLIMKFTHGLEAGTWQNRP